TYSELRKRAAEAEAKLNRLYESIENGLLTASDGSLKERVDELTRDQTQTDSGRISSSVERLAPTITADSLHRFAMAARRMWLSPRQPARPHAARRSRQQH